jgi:hypothetical protein
MDSERTALVKEETERQSSGTVQDAEEAVTELRAALERAGIRLPRPLVELGRCTVETARRLAAALPEEGGRS